MKKFLALCLTCAAPVLLAACGDDEEDEGGGAQQTQTAPAPADTGTEPAGGAGGGATIDVTMEANQFIPKDVEVARGGKVKWDNTDTPVHTVTYKGGPGVNFNKTLNPGDTFEQKFDSAGKVDYVCTIHPGQEGTVTVR
jgi:plastocyanin